jgi:hypothetical protein
LELAQVVGAGPDLVWRELAIKAMGGQQSRDFPDAPLDSVLTIAAIGDVRGAEVLARWQDVLDTNREQSAKRDQEGMASSPRLRPPYEPEIPTR